eukprot:scaffold495254_cov55-Prasinocladus_malaysianus.AAC.1
MNQRIMLSMLGIALASTLLSSVASAGQPTVIAPTSLRPGSKTVALVLSAPKGAICSARYAQSFLRPSLLRVLRSYDVTGSANRRKLTTYSHA